MGLNANVESVVGVRCCHLGLWESCRWGSILLSALLWMGLKPCEGHRERFPWEPPDWCAISFYSLKFILFCDYLILGKIRGTRGGAWEISSLAWYLVGSWKKDFSSYHLWNLCIIFKVLSPARGEVWMLSAKLVQDRPVSQWEESSQFPCN